MQSTRFDDLKNVQNDFIRNDPSGAVKYFRDKMNFTTGPVELSSALEKGTHVNILDVREKDAYDQGHIPGAIHLPKEEWPSLKHLDRNSLNVIYCYSEVCHLGARACVFFANEGFSVMELDGGFSAWKENNLKVERSSREAA